MTREQASWYFLSVEGFKKFISNIFLTLCAALLAPLAFPSPISDNGWGVLIFIAFIPAYIAINRSCWSYIWLEGFTFGFVFYLVYNFWLKTFHPLAILIAPILESVQYMLLFPILKSATSLFKKRGYLVQALFHLAYLYITQQGFLAYPYGNPAAALWNMPYLIQSASIFGIWGICILILLPQTFIAESVTRKIMFKKRKKDILVYSIIFLLNLLLGSVVYSHYLDKKAGKTVRIASIQHSADSWQGGYATYKKNFETLSSLTMEAMEEKPEMVVWSETAFVPSVSWHMAYPSNALTSALVEDFVNFGLNLDVPLVTGNPEGVIADENKPALLENGEWNRTDYNTVIHFADGVVKKTYRKQHLVPFTEHFPYQKQFPRLTALLIANDYNWWETGTESTVFEASGFRFSTPICFEDTFGYLSAEFVLNGADALINLSNDSWSGSVAAEMQHMQLSVFRAIENRRPLLRSTNSGITCLIDPSGKVLDMVEPFIQTWHIFELPLFKKSGTTFYTRHPDSLAKISLPASVIIFICGLVLSKKEKRKMKEYKHFEKLFVDDDRYWS